MVCLFNEDQNKDREKKIFLCVKTSNNKMHKNANLTTFYSSVISFLFSGSIIVRCYNEHCIDAAPGNISVALVWVSLESGCGWECCEGPGLQWSALQGQSVSGHPPFWVSPTQPGAGSNCSLQSGTQTVRLQDQPAEWGQGLQQNSLQLCIENIFNESESFQNES